MALSNTALSPALRLLLAQEVVPVSVRHVVMTVPESAAGKLLFNIVRHVLNLSRYDAAAAIDLQRLQMSSQLIGVVLCFFFCRYGYRKNSFRPRSLSTFHAD